jgi:photosystem II stability/assembly factor-like uncharacterized protein
MKHLMVTSILVLFLAVTAIHAAEAETRNWNHTEGPYGGSVWALHVAGGGNMIAGTLGKGVYFSTDSGQNWLQSNLDNVSVYDFARGSGETWFAATQNGVYRSENNGRSWRRMAQGMDETRVQAVLVHESGRVFAATIAGGIYISDNNGSSWSQSNEGMELNFGYALAALPDGSVLAGVTNRIYRSNDGGDSWEMMDADFPHVRTNAIAVADGRVFAATQDGVYRSEDNGRTWQETGSQFADKEVYDIVVTSGGLVASTRGGIYRSADNGANWEPDGLAGQPVYSLGYGGGVLAAGANPGVFVRN